MAVGNRGFNSFTRALEENNTIDERFRQLIHDTFDGMYSAMGKKNFLRWINQKNISERIKSLVVDEFSEEDLKKYPNWVGFYTHGTNSMKLDEQHTKDERTTRHELNHFFTDYYATGVTFPTFINEGITEYLNREYETIIKQNQNVSYSYAQNVDFVEFLHRTMGDSLMKAYLTGTSKQFSNEFSTYITKDGKPNSEELNHFYELLNEVHGVLHPNKNPETAQEVEKYTKKKEQMTKLTYPKLRQYAVNIAVNSIRKKAHDLEYYKNGKLNADAITDDIASITNMVSDLLQKHQTFGYSGDISRDTFDFKESIMKDALKAVLEESHIDNDKMEAIVTQSVQLGVIQKNPYGPGIMATSPRIDGYTFEKLIDEPDQTNVIQKLMEKRLGNAQNYTKDGSFHISSFLMDASLVLNRFDIEQGQKKLLIDSMILRHLPKDIHPDLVKELVDKHSKLYVLLYQKEQDNKRNVVDSQFVKVADNVFIEKRDNHFYFLQYDEKTGTIREDEMKPTFEDALMRFPKEKVDQFGGSLKRITYYDRSGLHTQTHILLFNEDFSRVRVDGKDKNVMRDCEALADSYLIDEAMKPILDGIHNKKYVSILNDGEAPIPGVGYTMVVPDTRSRVVRFKQFSKDIHEQVSQLPTEYRNDVLNSLIGALIGFTYHTSIEKYPQLRRMMESGELTQEQPSEETLSTLYSLTEQLNQGRRNTVKKLDEVNAMTFRTEEAKTRYTENEAAKQRRKEEREFYQDVNAFVMTSSAACIQTPLEVKSDKQHYSTIDGVKYPFQQGAYYTSASAEKVDYEAFCCRLKEKLSEVPEVKKEKFIEQVVSNSLELWYGNGSGYAGDTKIQTRRENLEEEMIQIVSDNVLNGVNLDTEKLAEMEGEFVSISKEEVEKCEAILDIRKPKAFEFESAKATYEAAKTIHDSEILSDEQKGKIVQQLKDKNQLVVAEKKKMSAFEKLALSGENVPSASDVRTASRLINFYQDVSRGE